MNFFTELTRRNVIRVGIAYVVGSWLAIQVADIMFDAFGVPDWAMRLVIILAAIGLPLVLFVAWAYELTPEGLKKESEVDRSESIAPRTGQKLNLAIMGLLLLAVAYLLFDKFDGDAPETATAVTADSTPAEAETVEAEAPVINPRSIAVLPFENRSRLEDDVFFVDGVHDDLLTNLARIGDLKVISRTTVSRYRGTDLSIPEIAAELGVAHVMEGAVQRSGDTVRINVQLIEANTDEHLWAEIFDRRLTADNLFDIQTEISERIAGALETTLTPEEESRIGMTATRNLEAYDAYLRGRQALALNNSEGADRALAEFREAVRLDPEFALAWVGVANATHQAFDYSDMKLGEAQAILEEAVGKALAIDDQLGEAHLARDLLIMYTEYPQSANREEALRRAVTLSPGLAEAWYRYSDYLDDFDDRLEESLDMGFRAAELDPLSDLIQNQLISVLIILGRYDEAERRLLDQIALNPGFALNYDLMAGLNFSQGRMAEGLIWKRRAQVRDPGNIRYVLSEVWPLTTMGMESEYAGLVERIESADPNSSTQAFVETIINLRQNQLAAALETANGFATALEPASMHGHGFVAMVYQYMGDAARALEETRIMLGNPAADIDWTQVFDNNTFRGCMLAWTLFHAESESAGLAVADAVLDRYNAKSALAQSEDRLDSLVCHALRGEHETIMGKLDAAIVDNRVMGYWPLLILPAMEAHRNTPEFHAAIERIDAIMAEERERFRALEREEAK